MGLFDSFDDDWFDPWGYIGAVILAIFAAIWWAFR
jgi:hypothetical protein